MEAVLQISTAQGPAECQMFARFVLRTLLNEAQQHGLSAALLDSSESKHGLLSATVQLTGKTATAFAQQQQGTWQWVCPSPLRPKHPRKNWYIGIAILPTAPALPDNDEVVFQTCRASGKGGQHVNKTDSAVRATHLASGLSVRVESERSQHANKKRALMLLAQKLAAQHAQAQSHHAHAQHSQLYQVERGNPVRTFANLDFQETTAY